MRDRYIFPLVCFLLIELLLLTIPRESAARPEFSALQNSPCWKCHVNPLGGGERNATGFFAGKNLGLEATTDYLNTKFKDFGDFDPMIADKIQLGADVRVLWDYLVYHNNDLPENLKQGENSTFQFMQGQFYLDAQVLPVFQAVGGYDVANNTYEAYGLFDHLPAGIYAKIGRFILPFGLRLDDHTVFTRNAMGFGPLSQDTGIEAGIRPGPFFLTAALTNGSLGNNSPDRTGHYYSVTGQTGVRFWKMGLGLSGFHNNIESLVNNTYGAWATLGFWKIALLGEFDYQEQETQIEPTATAVTPAASPKVRLRPGSAAFAEAEIELIRGLLAQLRYTHWDPNWEKAETFEDQTTAGLLFYPIPYFSTTLQYKFNRRPADQDRNASEITALAHFYF